MRQEKGEMRKLTLALVAHDSKKETLVSLVKAHKEDLAQIDLVATENAGKMIQTQAGLPVTLLESGPRGGDLQIGALVANGELRAVIFLRDPLKAQPHEPDITALMRVCDVHDVPLGTNLSTGEAILHLMFEHPEALSGHHLASQYMEEIAVSQNID
jgi:methylglyoxal synthase